MQESTLFVNLDLEGGGKKRKKKTYTKPKWPGLVDTDEQASLAATVVVVSLCRLPIRCKTLGRQTLLDGFSRRWVFR